MKIVTLLTKKLFFVRIYTQNKCNRKTATQGKSGKWPLQNVLLVKAFGKESTCMVFQLLV
jgi:hypothetical protein